LQKYNYEKGFPEPVDLTGREISFTAYDPRSMKTEVAMELTSPEGKKYVGSVELDSEEKEKFFLLKDKAQQDGFMQKIMKRRGELVLRSNQTDLPGPAFLIAKFNQLPGPERSLRPETPD